MAGERTGAATLRVGDTARPEVEFLAEWTAEGWLKANEEFELVEMADAGTESGMAPGWSGKKAS